MLRDRPRMRFIFIGDSECGKSSIILRFYRNTFSEDYDPTRLDFFHKVVTIVDKRDDSQEEVDLEIWDIPGNVEWEPLQQLHYLAWDAIFLCYDVNNVRSFNKARTEWITQIRQHARDVPVILVGTKTDQRLGASLWAPGLDMANRVSPTEGAITATSLNAAKYVECSAKTTQGITGVFEEGVEAVFVRRNGPPAPPFVESFDEERRIRHLSKGFAHVLCIKGDN
ncbi:P-loop containing nucleoside triphosphate hydrolase protein [Nemania sp. FL0916]|nr:P-loop containing nucleoside triphosphate hydrolase protein [Nemania sp. FL0916]